jgi:hydrogenase maturation protein HypF
MYGMAVFAKKHLPVVNGLTATESQNLSQILKSGFRCPRTSSAGRLFDAVASLLDIRHETSFEAQAAMELEYACSNPLEVSPYPVTAPHRLGGAWVINWEPMVEAILAELAANVPRSRIAANFHRTLADYIVQIAQLAGRSKVVLSGGCFQNLRLLETTVWRLRQEGIQVYWPQRFPANDGGIALGQAIGAARQLHQEKLCA